jgi:nitric oxide reductase NorE protein
MSISSTLDAPPRGADAPDESSSRFEPPGGVLVWLVVFVEVATFGAGLVAFAVARRADPAVFQAGRASLDGHLALANTLLLLTGGYAMARALAATREGDAARAGRRLGGAIACGLGFLALKGVEWGGEIAHGRGLRHGDFFTSYWLLTGFHVLHVIAALVILGALARGVAKGSITAARHDDLEAGGVFWHLCDLVWILLYATVYLGGGAS